MFINLPEKLIFVGDRCIQENQLGYALKAYELANDKEKLSALGDVCLRENLFTMALQAYKLANNEMMIQFIKENFAHKIG